MGDRPAASPRKLRKARDAGLHPLSQRLAWLGSATVLLAAVLLARPAADAFLHATRRYWHRWLHTDQLSTQQMLDGTPDLLTGWLAALATILALGWLTAILLSMFQTGFWISRRLRSRPGPLTNLFEASRWQRTGWRLLGACLILVTASLVVLHGVEQGLAQLLAQDRGSGATWYSALAALILLLVLLGVVDAVIERRIYANEMRMTPEEIRREQRNTGISPELRRARRKRARQLTSAAAIEPDDEVLALVDWHRALLVVVAWTPEKWVAPRIARFAVDDLDPVLSSMTSRAIPVVREPSLTRRLFRTEPGLPAPADTLDELAVLLSEFPDRLRR